MNMLKVGIAGLRRGYSYFQVFEHLPQTEVACVCDIDEELTKSFASNHPDKKIYTDFDEFIEQDFDIAVIATPLPLHYQQSILSLEAGKNVLCEVTSATTIEECQNLIKKVKESNRKYMLAENYNYMPFVTTWKKLIADGLIGKVIYAEGEYVHDCRHIMKDTKGELTWRASLYPVLYCTHNLGPILYLLDDICVEAIGHSTGVNVAPELGAHDMNVALFKTNKGAIIKFLAGFSIAREPMHLFYSIYGTEGSLETDRYNWQTHTLLYSEHIPNLRSMCSINIPVAHHGAPPEALLGGHGTCEYMLACEFVKSIIEDTKPPIDVYEAVKYTLPGICALQSIQEGGKIIKVPDFYQW